MTTAPDKEPNEEPEGTAGTATSLEKPLRKPQEKPDGGAPPAGPREASVGDPFDHDDLPTPPGATLALLRSLLAPMRTRVVMASVLLLLQQAAVQAGPLLVAYAIDSAVPALRDGRHGPLIAVAAGYLACALAAGGLQFAFIGASARVNQDVLLDLRGRIFRHAQALSIDFHERYTSGRLISRSTTDVESLRELLDEGLQELIGVILAFVYISAMLLWLDLGLGAAALASFVPLYGFVRMYRRRAASVYTARSTAIAAVIVKFAETMNGIRPVRAWPPAPGDHSVFRARNSGPQPRNGQPLVLICAQIVSARGGA
ncbi:ABC transporter ATP-binding protein, partial [Streptomyces bottropensis]|uniref:ABC transporter ATP-binding protein n=1 Tax=Streptomyces bottropensis TaxID=42235 RepID=UPI0036B63215